MVMYATLLSFYEWGHIITIMLVLNIVYFISIVVMEKIFDS